MHTQKNYTHLNPITQYSDLQMGLYAKNNKASCYIYF